jgi:hypothetical protein
LFFFAAFQTTQANYCPALEPPRAQQYVVKISAGDVEDLLWQLQTAGPDTTLLLADGVYRLQPRQTLAVKAQRITIRSASGKREAVVIEGGHNNITINADDCMVADVTLRSPRFHNIQIRGEVGVLRAKMYNLHLVDAGQQFIKISAGDGTKGKFADDGLVACSLIEYTTYSHGTKVSPPSYTNGVDILAGKGWIIRDNVFRRIRSALGPAGPTILVWRNAIDTVIQRNTIVDSWRGISLGLSTPNWRSRGGSQVGYDHQNGLVENNTILALREPADAAIENNYAANSRILHNTVYYNEAINHTVDWSIEYRFSPTTAIIANNLTTLPIRKRPPLPQQESHVEGNVTNAKAAWFQDITVGDFHLTSRAPAIDRGVLFPESPVDIDGTARPIGRAADAGADEYPYDLELEN